MQCRLDSRELWKSETTKTLITQPISKSSNWLCLSLFSSSTSFYHSWQNSDFYFTSSDPKEEEEQGEEDEAEEDGDDDDEPKDKKKTPAKSKAAPAAAAAKNQPKITAFAKTNNNNNNTNKNTSTSNKTNNNANTNNDSDEEMAEVSSGASIIKVEGDVTRPQVHQANEARAILHIVDNSGKWPQRGVFGAISRAYPEPEKAYTSTATLKLGSIVTSKVSNSQGISCDNKSTRPTNAL